MTKTNREKVDTEELISILSKYLSEDQVTIAKKQIEAGKLNIVKGLIVDLTKAYGQSNAGRELAKIIADEIKRFAVRSWGCWEVIEEGPNYKIKRLMIEPGKSISNQYHNHRKEVWCIIEGEGQLFLESEMKVIRKGDSFLVDVGEKHRVKNISETEDLVAIEVQMGEKCEEDDIVRV